MYRTEVESQQRTWQFRRIVARKLHYLDKTLHWLSLEHTTPIALLPHKFAANTSKLGLASVFEQHLITAKQN